VDHATRCSIPRRHFQSTRPLVDAVGAGQRVKIARSALI
jgi:hypothetical protein